MKVFGKMLIALAILCLSTATLTAGNLAPTVTIEKVGYEPKVSVILENLLTPATVQITTQRDVVLEKETSQHDRFAKIFNLEKLKKGEYKVIVIVGQREIEQPFSIADDGLQINANLRREFFQPTVNVKEETLSLMMFSQQLTDVELEIKDANGRTVFEDKMPNVIRVERLYDLNNLRNGEYMLAVKTPRKTYYRDFEVK
jgi:hypothetical protein